MKKCRVTLHELETKTKYFYLFPDSTTIHRLYKNAGGSTKELKKLLRSHPEAEVITLKKGQWLEAEWSGCHIIYEGSKPISTSFFRLIKATNIKKNLHDNSLVSIHFGWMLSEHLRMCDGYHDGTFVTLLSSNDEQYEFSELFQDNETTEDLIKKADSQKVI
jgi:hypothetical protein